MILVCLTCGHIFVENDHKKYLPTHKVLRYSTYTRFLDQPRFDNTPDLVYAFEFMPAQYKCWKATGKQVTRERWYYEWKHQKR